MGCPTAISTRGRRPHRAARPAARNRRQVPDQRRNAGHIDRIDGLPAPTAHSGHRATVRHLTSSDDHSGLFAHETNPRSPPPHCGPGRMYSDHSAPRSPGPETSGRRPCSLVTCTDCRREESAEHLSGLRRVGAGPLQPAAPKRTSRPEASWFRCHRSPDKSGPSPLPSPGRAARLRGQRCRRTGGSDP